MWGRISTLCRTLLREGPLPPLARRLRAFEQKLKSESRLVGRLVELGGDRVRVGDLRIYVDNPEIPTPYKSALFFGLHEAREIDLVRRHLPRELPVVELGGGIGVVACAVNRLLDDPTRHLVLEANPALLETLERNRNENAARFRVVNAALAHGVERVAVEGGASFLTKKVETSMDAERGVPATALAPLLRAEGPGPFSLVVDIEGGEKDLIEQELDVLASEVGFLLIELHPDQLGENETRELLRSLDAAGFEVLERSCDVVALANGRLA